jgi:hypothetical protein
MFPLRFEGNLSLGATRLCCHTPSQHGDGAPVCPLTLALLTWLGEYPPRGQFLSARSLSLAPTLRGPKVEDLEAPTLREPKVEDLEAPTLRGSKVEDLEAPTLREPKVEDLEAPTLRGPKVEEAGR